MGLLTTTQQDYYEGTAGSLGYYQFVSLDDIISNFTVAYVGEDKIISKINRADIKFHAMRALQELSFDTLKSIKSQEIELPPSLTMMLPHDYVNYVKLTWNDGAGIEHVLYPASKTSNPSAISQDANGDYTYNGTNLATQSESDTWAGYKSNTSTNQNQSYDYDDENGVAYDSGRYGLDPQYAQNNGSFYIDELKGNIHFSSNISGKNITLKYISDSLGTDGEMQVHKFAEEAMYKWIAHAILATRANTQEYLVARFKKERFAAVRTAKLRLSNIKIEEITQIMRGKSKQIKH